MGEAATVARHPLTPEPLRVDRVVRETGDTVTLSMDVPSASGFHFLPGQFNMLYVFGMGEVPISISGDGDRPAELRHTIRMVGTVTDALGRLRRGAVVGVRGPYGSAWPLPEARGRDLVFVAGGLGLAPLRPAIRHVFMNRGEYERVWILLGARSPEDLLFRKELDQWHRRDDVGLYVTVDRAGRDWPGLSGVVTALVPSLPLAPEDTTAFVCGPEVMMRFAVRELEKKGMTPGNIFVSLERNMKCAVGYCGHCQMGPAFVCKDGPVLPVERLGPIMFTREV